MNSPTAKVCENMAVYGNENCRTGKVLHWEHMEERYKFELALLRKHNFYDNVDPEGEKYGKTMKVPVKRGKRVSKPMNPKLARLLI